MAGYEGNHDHSGKFLIAIRHSFLLLSLSKQQQWWYRKCYYYLHLSSFAADTLLTAVLWILLREQDTALAALSVC